MSRYPASASPATRAKATGVLHKTMFRSELFAGEVVHHDPRQDDHVGALAVEDELILNAGGHN